MHCRSLPWAALFLLLAAGSCGESPEELVRQADVMWKQERFEEALRLVDRAIEIGGERPRLIEYRCDLLFKLRRPQELLEATMRFEEISERKTPWNYLKIADAHIFLEDKEEALNWIEKAVRERGFRKFAHFDRDYYDFVRGEPRFVEILEEIQEDLGIGQPAKDFTTTLTDGDELTLSSLRGEVTLIDFWATWCQPCRAELPNLKELYAEFHPKGFEILSIGLDEPEALDRARAYIEENSLPWRLALSGRGWDDEVAALYKVNGLPSTGLIDRDGILRHVDLHGDGLRAAVEELIGG